MLDNGGILTKKSCDKNGDSEIMELRPLNLMNYAFGKTEHAPFVARYLLIVPHVWITIILLVLCVVYCVETVILD